MRFAITLAYHGGRYHGWQRQGNAHTVQAELEQALATILQQPIETMGCGRTDTGVHAKHFVAHFDYNASLPTDLVHRLNSLLPNDIAVNATVQTTDGFHARFDAVSRKYAYCIHFDKNPFLEGLSWKRSNNIQLDLMQNATNLLVGKKDFRCFCKGPAPNDNYECNVTEAHWAFSENGITFTITANRFLRNMVRAIVGTLLYVGSSKMTIVEFEQILKNGTRSDAGNSVPACGLFLEEVTYPNSDTLGSAEASITQT